LYVQALDPQLLALDRCNHQPTESLLRTVYLNFTKVLLRTLSTPATQLSKVIVLLEVELMSNNASETFLKQLCKSELARCIKFDYLK